jgi:hypothetical protein
MAGRTVCVSVSSGDPGRRERFAAWRRRYRAELDWLTAAFLAAATGIIWITVRPQSGGYYLGAIWLLASTRFLWKYRQAKRGGPS